VSGEAGVSRSFPWGELFVGTGVSEEYAFEDAESERQFQAQLEQEELVWRGFVDALAPGIAVLLDELALPHGSEVSTVHVSLSGGPKLEATSTHTDGESTWQTTSTLEVGHVQLVLRLAQPLDEATSKRLEERVSALAMKAVG